MNDYWGQVLILAKTLKNYYILLRRQEKKVEKRKEELNTKKIKSILDPSVNLDSLEKKVADLEKEVKATQKNIDDIKEKIKLSSPEVKQLFNFL